MYYLINFKNDNKLEAARWINENIDKESIIGLQVFQEFYTVDCKNVHYDEAMLWVLVDYDFTIHTHLLLLLLLDTTATATTIYI